MEDGCWEVRKAQQAPGCAVLVACAGECNPTISARDSACLYGTAVQHAEAVSQDLADGVPAHAIDDGCDGCQSLLIACAGRHNAPAVQTVLSSAILRVAFKAGLPAQCSPSRAA